MKPIFNFFGMGMILFFILLFQSRMSVSASSEFSLDNHFEGLSTPTNQTFNIEFDYLKPDGVWGKVRHSHHRPKRFPLKKKVK